MKLPPIITAAGLVLLASPVSLAVAQEAGARDTSFDEIVVTGTFIRRSEGFTPASPVQEISKADFDANAPRTVADFLTLADGFSSETDVSVWRRLLAGLDQIDRLVEGDERAALQARVRSLVTPALDRLGWEERDVMGRFIRRLPAEVFGLIPGMED